MGKEFFDKKINSLVLYLLVLIMLIVKKFMVSNIEIIYYSGNNCYTSVIF